MARRNAQQSSRRNPSQPSGRRATTRGGFPGGVKPDIYPLVQQIAHSAQRFYNGQSPTGLRPQTMPMRPVGGGQDKSPGPGGKGRFDFPGPVTKPGAGPGGGPVPGPNVNPGGMPQWAGDSQRPNPLGQQGINFNGAGDQALQNYLQQQLQNGGPNNGGAHDHGGHQHDHQGGGPGHTHDVNPGGPQQGGGGQGGGLGGWNPPGGGGGFQWNGQPGPGGGNGGGPPSGMNVNPGGTMQFPGGGGNMRVNPGGPQQGGGGGGNGQGGFPQSPNDVNNPANFLQRFPTYHDYAQRANQLENRMNQMPGPGSTLMGFPSMTREQYQGISAVNPGGPNQPVPPHTHDQGGGGNQGGGGQGGGQNGQGGGQGGGGGGQGGGGQGGGPQPDLSATPGNYPTPNSYLPPGSPPVPGAGTPMTQEPAGLTGAPPGSYPWAGQGYLPPPSNMSYYNPGTGGFAGATPPTTAPVPYATADALAQQYGLQLGLGQPPNQLPNPSGGTQPGWANPAPQGPGMYDPWIESRLIGNAYKPQGGDMGAFQQAYLQAAGGDNAYTRLAMQEYLAHKAGYGQFGGLTAPSPYGYVAGQGG